MTIPKQQSSATRDGTTIICQGLGSCAIRCLWIPLGGKAIPRQRLGFRWVPPEAGFSQSRHGVELLSSPPGPCQRLRPAARRGLVGDNAGIVCPRVAAGVAPEDVATRFIAPCANHGGSCHVAEAQQQLWLANNNNRRLAVGLLSEEDTQRVGL